MKDMYLRSIGFLLIVLLGSTVQVYAGRAKKSNPEDLAKAVALSHQLEADPLGGSALEARRWLVRWLEKAPDITVHVCRLLGPLPTDEHPYSAEISTQMLFSNAAYQIEHPEKSEDMLVIQVAGVEGALKVYQIILKSEAKARVAFLDDLVIKRDRGELIEALRPAVADNCGS